MTGCYNRGACYNTKCDPSSSKSRQLYHGSRYYVVGSRTTNPITYISCWKQILISEIWPEWVLTRLSRSGPMEGREHSSFCLIIVLNWIKSIFNVIVLESQIKTISYWSSQWRNIRSHPRKNFHGPPYPTDDNVHNFSKRQNMLTEHMVNFQYIFSTLCIDWMHGERSIFI